MNWRTNWFVVLCVLIAPSLLMAHVVTVDGDPSDWVGAASGAVHDSACSGGEWIYTSADNGRFPAPDYDDMIDMVEVRFTTDCDNLYFLVKMVDIAPGEEYLVNLAITFDVDCDGGLFDWIGDDSLSPGPGSIGTFHDWDYQLNVHQVEDPLGIVIEKYDSSGSWSSPMAYFTVVSADNDCVEGYVSLADLGMTCGSSFFAEAATFYNTYSPGYVFNNLGDSTQDQISCDAIDTMTCGYAPGDPQNAWDRDIWDCNLDFPCDCIDCACLHPLDNDTCANATNLLCNAAAPLTGDLCCATDEYDSFAQCGFPSEDDVWYSFTVNQASYVAITVTPESSLDVRFIVASGGCSPAPGAIACVDGMPVGGGIEIWDSRSIPEILYPGTAFYVIVEGSCGSFDVKLECDPAFADECSDADGVDERTILVDSELPFSETIDTAGYVHNYSSVDDDYGCTGYHAYGPDVAYKIVGGVAEDYLRFSWGPATHDSSMYLVTDCSDVPNTCVAGSDLLPGETETFDFCVGIGETYYLILDGWDVTDVGYGPLTITSIGACPPPENTCTPGGPSTPTPTSYPPKGTNTIPGSPTDVPTTTSGASIFLIFIMTISLVVLVGRKLRETD